MLVPEWSTTQHVSNDLNRETISDALQNISKNKAITVTGHLLPVQDCRFLLDSPQSPQMGAAEELRPGFDPGASHAHIAAAAADSEHFQGPS